MDVVILTEADLRQCVSLDQHVISAIEVGFTRLARGEVQLPPVMMLDFPESLGEVDIKSAHIHGYEAFAVKIASGFLNNRELGLATGSGMMALISTKTGVPIAVLLDNGYLTDVRTGAAGAVAAKYLARDEIETVGVIGTGNQARYQLVALGQVRNFRRLRVYGPTSERVRQYAREMEELFSVETVIEDDVEAVVRGSDIVITTTPSRSPLVRVEWAHPGLHITAMGSDAEHKQELDPALLARADIVACDFKTQCLRLGELHHAVEQGILAPQTDIIELGQLTSGQKKGRTDYSQLTVCDLTGTGVQDTIIAVLAYQEAQRRGLGKNVRA